MQTKQSVINSNIRAIVVAAFGVLTMVLGVSETAQAQTNQPTPLVFQAAGPDATSIQGAVDAFRASLGDNNANNPGPIQKGRREINWDGGNPNLLATTAPVTPFNVFLNTRGGQFTTPGTGLSQAPPAADPAQFPPGGLAGLFNNPTYGDIFSAFSPLRLFTPVGSNITDALFFVPNAPSTDVPPPATVRGFGAVFTDVDQPDGIGPRKRHRHHRRASTLIEYYDVDDKLIFRGAVPASPGDGSLSFFGIVFEEAIIARVRITTGNVAPGPDDDEKNDIVMMDDFFYGEPQPLASH
jgi:hypothetical protein